MARITVTPAEEDEVIVAGAKSAPTASRAAGEPQVTGSYAAEEAPVESTHAAEERPASSRGGEEPLVSSHSLAEASAPLLAAEGRRPEASTPEGAPVDSAGSPMAGSPVSARTPSSAPTPRATPKKREEYRETTLEDLESSPMPFAQKAVIIAAVVCIIGALVYYFVAMR